MRCLCYGVARGDGVGKGIHRRGEITVTLKSGRHHGINMTLSSAWSEYKNLVEDIKAGKNLEQSGDDFAWCVTAAEVESTTPESVPS
jgi:hypothetical protein